jgi:hypothetical protein
MITPQFQESFLDIIGCIAIGAGATFGFRGKWLKDKLETYEEKRASDETRIRDLIERIKALEEETSIWKIKSDGFVETSIDFDVILAIVAKYKDNIETFLTESERAIISEIARKRETRAKVINDRIVEMKLKQSNMRSLEAMK